MICAARGLLALPLATVLLAVSAPAALAHFIGPETLQITVDPNDPDRLWARATYGVLSSLDGGLTWDWICTAVAGYAAEDGGALAVLADGAVLSTSYGGVWRSPAGCAWSEPEPAIGRGVTGLSVDPQDPSRLVVLVSRADGDAFESLLWESSDSGASFQRLGVPLDTASVHQSLVQAPSDPSRLYVAGRLVENNEVLPLVRRSTDRAEAWQTTMLDLPPWAQPWIAGVHPTDPDRLYVAADLAPEAGAEFVEGVLLFSDDGGLSFSEVVRRQTRVLAFSWSADGTRVAVGFGDPRSAAPVQVEDFGIYTAAEGSDAFSRVQAGHVACLSRIAGDLWACRDPNTSGFVISRSADDGASFVGVLELAGLRGPQACETGSETAQTCPLFWDAVCTETGKCEPEGDDDDSAVGPPDGCGCEQERESVSLGLLALFALMGQSRLRRRQTDID